ESGIPGLNRLFKIIRPFHLYLSAKDLVVACDIEHVEVRTAETEVRHLSFRLRNRNYCVHSPELIQDLDTTKASNINPAIPVAFQTIAPCIFIRVAHVQPSILLLVQQGTI